MRVETASLADTEQWCKWVYSVPHNGTTAIHPLRGGNCDQIQNDPNLFFLTGTDEHYKGGHLQRSVKVPKGKSIVFPLTLCMYSTAEFPKKDLKQLLDEAKDENKSTYELKLIINNVPHGDLNQHLVESDKPFDLYFPNDNVLGITPQKSQGVCAAYMVKLTPEREEIEQSHTIQFGGKCRNCGYTTDHTYKVN